MKLDKYCTKERIRNLRQLTDTEYNGFVVTQADDMVSTEDVIVPPNFAESHTQEKKITKAIDFYKNHGYFDKPIKVIPETNERGEKNKLVLIDGLSRYISAIRLHIDIIGVNYIDIDNIGYILN
jgi:hypothetical protein